MQTKSHLSVRASFNLGHVSRTLWCFRKNKRIQQEVKVVQSWYGWRRQEIRVLPWEYRVVLSALSVSPQKYNSFVFFQYLLFNS